MKIFEIMGLLLLLAIFLLLTRLPLHSNQLELLKMENEEFRTLLADFRQVEAERRSWMDRTYPELLNKMENMLDRTMDDFRVKEKPVQPLLDSADESYEGVYEVERLYRRIHVGVKEMWYYTSSELKKLSNLTKEGVVQKKIYEILEEGVEHKRTLSVVMCNLSVANGRMDWVKKEIKDLEEIVERRLMALQNPSDCDSAKKVVCDMSSCGFGCQVHHAVYCLMMAYGTQRTMILKENDWHYNRDGWESVFQPLSNTCINDSGITKGNWTWPLNDTIQVITLPPYYVLKHWPPFLPPAIPKDLSERLMTVHGDPSAWWIAQFVKYLIRPQEPLAQYLKDMMGMFDFEKPIVGVHVRRTDKIGTEAAFHSIEEYMQHVEEYYDTLALRQEVPVRRVFLSSDDPSIYADVKNKFPGYIYYGDPDVTISAATSTRYSFESLKGLLVDVYLLVHTDYLVCTFSSNIGRLAYEIMQTLYPDPSVNVRSIDSIYYFDGQPSHTLKMLYNHRARANSSQLEMKVGDEIVVGRHDGYTNGLNRRTNRSGVYQSFKADAYIPLFELNQSLQEVIL